MLMMMLPLLLLIDPLLLLLLFTAGLLTINPDRSINRIGDRSLLLLIKILSSIADAPAVGLLMLLLLVLLLLLIIPLLINLLPLSLMRYIIMTN